jgi:hypothetical protein
MAAGDAKQSWRGSTVSRAQHVDRGRNPHTFDVLRGCAHARLFDEAFGGVVERAAAAAGRLC